MKLQFTRDGGQAEDITCTSRLPLLTRSETELESIY